VIENKTNESETTASTTPTEEKSEDKESGNND